jgi:hypothetical protein
MDSVVTCPVCRHQHVEQIPEDNCMVFYKCSNCHAEMIPKEGHCCVLCSYGSVRCFAKQSSE